jgi:uncharacterized damage-inducible protein DinB
VLWPHRPPALGDADRANRKGDAGDSVGRARRQVRSILMTVDDLKRRYDYGYWANQRIFGVVAQLTPAEFTQGVAGSWGSIRNTLVHTMSAEWGWIDRCGGPPRGPALKADDYMNAESLIRQWGVVEAHVRQFLDTLHDDDLRRTIEFSLPQTGKRTMVLGELLEHGANHAVHHRGQVAVLLRMLEHAPGNFDLLFYDAERRAVSGQ